MSTAKFKKLQRPALPLESANPLLKTVESIPVVKYQIIEREGQEIIIGRVKVPTPNNGHAFILRRFDTGSVSLTTMFRAAFPDASDEEEKADTTWIKQTYDIAGANGGYKGANRQFLRLAGTWLPTDVALTVAESYAILNMVKPLTEAEPEASQSHRKSNGVQEVQEVKPPAPTKALSPPAAKRRKAASPASTSTTSTAPLSPPPPTPTRKLRSSKSPAPKKPASTTKPRSTRKQAAKAATPPTDPIEIRSDDDEPVVASVDPEVDIEESKRLVEEVKATYVKPASRKGGALKRSAEEDKLTFQPKEPEVGERQIAGPRRLRDLPPQRQSAVWGALLFAIGLGAAMSLPQSFL